MPSVYIRTYGCQMNERDSEAVAAQLVGKGYTLAASEHVADVVLLNTCSVRDNAEQKAINKMENIAGDIRKHRPDVVLGFLGCMAQSRGQELIDRLPDLDLVVGTQKFHRTAEYLDEILSGRRGKIVDVAAEQGSEGTIREHLLNGNAKSKSVTAFVSIMQGCNQYCTFCIVPYTRGEERSRSIPDILAECRQLVAQGVKEITLLGQIVTSYGRRKLTLNGRAELPLGPDAQQRVPTAKGKSPFVQLLEAVHAIEGLERIRFTSPHPKGYGDDLVDAYARLPKLAGSAHLPVQSGSDRVLKLMHRGYTRARYLEIIRKLRAARPGTGITSDIIVGFPGETEADFAETLEVVEEVGYDGAFTFVYSPRRGTEAAEMPVQVAEEVKRERIERLVETVQRCAAARNAERIGRVEQVLVEGVSRTDAGLLRGRTRRNTTVNFTGSTAPGELVDVAIDGATSTTLQGSQAVLACAS